MADLAVQTLDGIKLFADLTAAEREQAAKVCRWKRYAAGEQIIDSQSDTRDVCFVVGGMARVANYSLSGREVSLDDVGPGHYFGELAAIDGNPRSASVVAVEETVVAAMPSEYFIRLITEHPKLAFSVMKSLARVIRSSTDRIMDLSTLGANNRVHAELLRLARAVAGDDERAVIKPIPHHSDIAARVSTTRETVARVLSDLSRNGIVKRDKDALIVLSMDELEELVENVRGE